MQGEGQNEFSYKLILIGDACVGKTTMVYRLLGKIPPLVTSATIGAEYNGLYLDKNFDVYQYVPRSWGRQKRLRHIQLWDTAGAERFVTFTRMYFRNSDIIVLMFDVTDPNSLCNCRLWCRQVDDELGPRPHVFVILGNKTDLLTPVHNFRTPNVREFTQSPVLYREGSALEGIGYEDIWQDIIHLYESHLNPVRTVPPKNSLSFTVTKIRKCCI